MHNNFCGRPLVYTGAVKCHMLNLIREYNISQAMDILNATPGTSLSRKRDVDIVPCSLGVSYPTLIKFAREAGIQKRRGRPETADSLSREDKRRKRRKNKFQVC